MSKQNSYAQKAKRKQLLGIPLSPVKSEGNIKKSAIETGKDIIAGVIVGGVIGAVVGRPSFVVGIASSVFGYYQENRWLTSFGLGMMTSGAIETAQLKGPGETYSLEGIKERLEIFKNSLAHKLYLDKVIKKKTTTTTTPTTTGALGEVKYFRYPEAAQAEGFEELAELDDIERELALAGEEFVRSEEAYGAIDEEVGALEAERIY